MAMRRDIATLRTTFEVAGADKPITAAKDVAKALDAVAAAASRNARAGAEAAAAGDRVAASARSQALAIATAARETAAANAAAARAATEAQTRTAAAAEQAAKNARRQFEEARRLAAESAKAERAEAQARTAAREADLRNELAAIDKRSAARKSAHEHARRRAASERDAIPALSERSDEINRQVKALDRGSDGIYDRILAENKGKSAAEIDDLVDKAWEVQKAKINALREEERAIGRRIVNVRALERRARLGARVVEHGEGKDEAARTAARARFEAPFVPPREAALQGDLARLDARGQARRAMLEQARSRAAEAAELRSRNLAEEAAERKALRQINFESNAKLRKQADAKFSWAGEDTRDDEYERLLRDREDRRFELKRRIERISDINEAQGSKLPGVQRRLARAEAVEAGRAPQEEAQRARIQAELDAVRAAEAEKVAATKASREAQVAQARAAMEEAQRILAQETEAVKAAAAAQTKAVAEAAEAEAKAVRAAADAEIQARREAAAAKARAEHEAAQARVAAEEAEAKASAAGAVRVAQLRYDRTKKAAADAVRKAQGDADDRVYNRKLEFQDDLAGLDAEVAARRHAREAMQARLDAMPKSRPGSETITEADLDRLDLEMRLADQAKLDKRSDRNAVEEKRGIGLDIRNLERNAAEQVRIVREAEDEKVAAAQRTLTEVRQVLALETEAAKHAAAEQAEAAKEAAKARAKAAADAAASIDRIAAGAKAAADKAKAKRELDAEITAGLADPDALRARARAAAEDHAAYAAKAADKLGLSRARVAGARGTDAEAEVAEREARAARGIETALTVKERAAARYAAALVEVERRLKAVAAEEARTRKAAEAEAETQRKAVAAEAERQAKLAHAEVERALAGVRKRAAEAAARRDEAATRQAFDADVADGMRDPAALRRRMEAAQARAARARSQFEDRSAAAAEALGRDPAGARARAGELEAASGAVARSEASARRLAAAYAEVEARLRAAASAADAAARGFDRAASSAQQRLAAIKAERQYERDLNRGLGDPAGAQSRAAAFAAAYEKATARVVAAAAEAKAAIEAAARAGANPADLARIEASEQGKVTAAERRAARLDTLARRSGAVAAEVARRQARAADEAARAQEAAARRSAQAWDNLISRSNRLRRALPRLGLLPGNIMGRLATQGALPVLGGAARSIGRLFGGILGTAGSVGRGALGVVGGVAGGVFGFLRGLVTGAGSAVAALGRIGLSAAEVAGRLALSIGRTAVSTLSTLGSTALSTAKSVAAIAQRVAIRITVAGLGAAMAGLGLARKAVADTAEEAYGLRERSMQLGTGGISTQRLMAGAGAAGVKADDMVAAFASAREKIRDIGQDPALMATFQRLNIWTRDSYGRVLDTASVIQTVMQRVSTGQMNWSETSDLLTRLFGSPEAVERILPLLQKMRQDAGFLQKAFARKQELGAVIGATDIRRMQGWTHATEDLKDAFLGLKLAVARAVGNDVIKGYSALATLIGRSRHLVAEFARKAFDVGAGLTEVLITGRRVAETMNLVGRGGGLARFLLDGAWHARRLAIGMWDAGKAAVALGAEVKRAVEGVWLQQRSPGQVWIQARPAIVMFAEGLWYAARGAAFVGRMARETALALRGLDGQVVEFPWLLTLRDGLFTVGRVAREAWMLVTGREAQVVEFPWLLTIRDRLGEAGRFAKATWSAIRGRDEGISEFPAIFRVRDVVVEAFGTAKAFATEAWAAIRGDGATYPQFPWLFTLADQVRTFAADVKATWLDLGNVWSGGAAETTVGAWVQTALAWYGRARQGVEEFVAFARDAMASFAAGWNGAEKGDAVTEWARRAGELMHGFADSAQAAFDVVSKIFKAFDTAVQAFTWGKVDGETVLLTVAMLSLFGITRGVVGIFTAGALAARGLGGILAKLGIAAGAAGAAGGLAGAEAAAAAAGGAAAGAAGRWGGLLDKLKGVASFIGRSPILMGLLGISGHFAAESVEGNDGGFLHNTYEWAKSTLGRGVEYGAIGAGVGGLAGAAGLGAGAIPGAALGGAGGFLYGILSGDGEYADKREAFEKKRAAEILRQQGKGAEADALLRKQAYEPWPEHLSGGDAEDALAQAQRETDAATRGLAESMGGLREQLAAVRADAMRQVGSGSRPAWKDGYADAFGGGRAPAAAVGGSPIGAPGAPGSFEGWQAPPRPDGGQWGVGAVPPWYQVKADMAEAASKAASAAVARAEHRAAADPMGRLMRGSDPMSSLYTAPQAPAPVPAPAPAPAPGPQASLGSGQSEFTVRLTNGRDARFSGSRSDVADLRREMDRGLPATTWSTA